MYGGQAIGIEKGLPGEYLLDALFAVGPTEFVGGEETAVSWSELAGYMQATGAITEPWEAEAVRAMSRAYLDAKREGKNIHCIAPVDREGLEE